MPNSISEGILNKNMAVSLSFAFIVPKFTFSSSTFLNSKSPTWFLPFGSNNPSSTIISLISSSSTFSISTSISILLRNSHSSSSSAELSIFILLILRSLRVSPTLQKLKLGESGNEILNILSNIFPNSLLSILTLRINSWGIFFKGNIKVIR